MHVSFRCKNCGRLEASEHAGECEVPHACRVCGYGVSFDPRTGIKKCDHDNWEKLAEADPERLADLGLAPELVVAHVPAPQGSADPGRAPRQVSVEADESLSQKGAASSKKTT